MGALSCQHVRHPAMHDTHLRLIVISPPDAGLVGNDEDQKAGIVQRLHRGRGTGHPTRLRGFVRVTSVLDQHAIAVEKRGGAACHGRNFVLGAGQILGDADIDEGRVIQRAAQQSGVGQLREYVGFQRDRALADPVHHRSVQRVDAAIDGPVAAGRAGQEAAHHAVRRQFHSAVATAGCGAPQRQGGRRPGRVQRQVQQVDGEHRVAVEQQELPVEMLPEQPQRAGGAQRPRFDQDFQRGAADGAAGIAGGNLLRLVAGQQRDAFEAVPGHLIDLPVQERLAGDRRHRLGHGLGQSAQAGAAAADQDGRLLHASAASTPAQ